MVWPDTHVHDEHFVLLGDYDTSDDWDSPLLLELETRLAVSLRGTQNGRDNYTSLSVADFQAFCDLSNALICLSEHISP